MMALPNLGFGRMERLGWKQGLETKLVSIEELKELFPDVELIKSENDYQVYGHPMHDGNYEKLAYECRACEGIILGAPNVVDVNTISFLVGRQGYDVYCRNCDALIKEYTFARG